MGERPVASNNSAVDGGLPPLDTAKLYSSITDVAPVRYADASRITGGRVVSDASAATVAGDATKRNTATDAAATTGIAYGSSDFKKGVWQYDVKRDADGTMHYTPKSFDNPVGAQVDRNGVPMSFETGRNGEKINIQGVTSVDIRPAVNGRQQIDVNTRDGLTYRLTNSNPLGGFDKTGVAPGPTNGRFSENIQILQVNNIKRVGPHDPPNSFERVETPIYPINKPVPHANGDPRTRFWINDPKPL